MSCLVALVGASSGHFEISRTPVDSSTWTGWSWCRRCRRAAWAGRPRQARSHCWGRRCWGRAAGSTPDNQSEVSTAVTWPDAVFPLVHTVIVSLMLMTAASPTTATSAMPGCSSRWINKWNIIDTRMSLTQFPHPRAVSWRWPRPESGALMSGSSEPRAGGRRSTGCRPQERVSRVLTAKPHFWHFYSAARSLEDFPSFRPHRIKFWSNSSYVLPPST